MTTMQKWIILFIGLTILSCNQMQTKQNETVRLDTVTKHPIDSIIITDTITGLLDKSLLIDTLEFDNLEPFLFFKSGYFLSKKDKNAIVVSCPTSKTYMIKLYCIKDNNWEMTDSIIGLEAFPTQFDPIFNDFNFDKQTDIYIQVSASNGWCLSRGHLLIIDPLTKKINLHKESRDLANMKPDPKTKTVISELWRGYNSKGQHQLTMFTNKWVNGQLKTIKKKNITFK